MAHNHSHNHTHNHSEKNILFAFFLNLFFAIIEVLGGIYTNSVAIISDAVHDFGDSISLGITWFLEKKSKQKSDNRFTYGYRRFSLLGAIFISFVLMISTFFVIKESIERIISPEPANAKGMFLFAIFGLIVNGAAVLKLKRGNSFSERAVMLHLLEDVLGWVAVLIASIVMYFVEIPIIDPILSLCISCWILYNIYRNLKSTFSILLQQIPADIDLESIQSEILELQSIESIHDVHAWSLDGEHNVLTLHVVVPVETPVVRIEALKCDIRTICKKGNVDHVTIEMERDNENCGMDSCGAPH